VADHQRSKAHLALDRNSGPKKISHKYFDHLITSRRKRPARLFLQPFCKGEGLLREAELIYWANAWNRYFVLVCVCGPAPCALEAGERRPMAAHKFPRLRVDPARKRQARFGIRPAHQTFKVLLHSLHALVPTAQYQRVTDVPGLIVLSLDFTFLLFKFEILGSQGFHLGERI
jgi:hypothetical protein